ncbi:MAG: enoyl-CoA hydratase/isomerase family protein [Candidatus Hydrogenedentota bacterium]|nr:MAG: enoyl-CoA hydratase/isomerase family protein [Candidatus Hydrogenedentota bacterium]
MSYEQILFEVSDRVATITLNRPERLNAWTPRMAAELIDALRNVDNDDDIAVAILTGAGRGFCAGMDLSAGGSTFDPSAQPATDQAESGPEIPGGSIINSLLELKKPIIVAVNGPTVGVGVTMILPMDIRIAAESARFGMVFVRRGVIPELASPWFLPRIVGVSKAAELMYTGRIIGAEEALECGLVSRVVPDAELLRVAREMASEISMHAAPVSLALTKRMLWQFLAETDLKRVEEINHTYFAWTGTQPDCHEGIVSFLEKRPPRWTMKVSEDMPDFFPLT